MTTFAPRRFAGLVALGALWLLPACSTATPGETATEYESAPTEGSLVSDALAEIIGTDSEADLGAVDPEFEPFCSALDEALPPAATDPDSAQSAANPEEVLRAYREALALAPPQIARELSALLDFLEFGIEPTFAELPESTAPAAEVLEGDPTDPYVFITPDAEQLALSVVEFLELHCRSVAVSPLPPPTVPSAVTSDP